MAVNSSLESQNEGLLFEFEAIFASMGRVKNVLVLEILPYDFLLDNETENTKSTLKIEYE